MKVGSAEGATYQVASTIVVTVMHQHFAPSALQRLPFVPPGPMAQAITFRAFGAEKDLTQKHTQLLTAVAVTE